MITIALLVPFIVLHVFDYRKADWKVGGAARKALQTALVRKFLNYSEESRAKLAEGDLVMATTVDVPDLVNKGYMKALILLKALGSLLVMFSFQFVAPLI